MPVVVLVDTNVWVSALINPHGAPARIRQAFANGEFRAVISVQLLEEVTGVLERPRIRQKYGLDDTEIGQFVRLLAEKALHAMPAGSLHACRDPKDDMVLETAIAGQAQYMVTRDDDIKRDQDLIGNMQSRGITVLSIQTFLDRLEQGDL